MEGGRELVHKKSHTSIDAREPAMNYKSITKKTQEQSQKTISQKTISQKEHQLEQQPYTYEYVNYISLEDYISYLRYDVFPNVDKPVLKEFLYYLFHFDRSNRSLFMNFKTFIDNKDILGALKFFKTVINIEEVKRNLQNALSQYGIISQETKDLDTILHLYVETVNPDHAQRLLRYLLFLDFASLETFMDYIRQYLSYESDELRYISLPQNIYSSYKL